GLRWRGWRWRRLDRAGRWHVERHDVLPLLRRALLSVLLPGGLVLSLGQENHQHDQNAVDDRAGRERRPGTPPPLGQEHRPAGTARPSYILGRTPAAWITGEKRSDGQRLTVVPVPGARARSRELGRPSPSRSSSAMRSAGHRLVVANP